jgi:hypothetical protein
MAVNLSPVGGVAAQFFTNSGAVLTGGKLFTYLAGTTTPATTYTSSNGATAWTNPIVLDSAGRVPGSGEIWLTDGILYKFILKDANDVLIATYDNISGINSNFIAFVNQQEIVTATAGQTVFNLGISYQPGTNSLSVFVDGVNQYGPGALYAYTETDANTVTFTSGLHVGAEVKFTTTQQQSAGAVDAQQVSYEPPFTGSVATNVEAKLAQTVSVLDFGADPTGVVDSAAAFAAAIAAADCVYVPTGTYEIGSNISITTPVRMYGDGPGATVIERNYSPVSDTQGVFAFSGGGTIGCISNMTIRSKTGQTGGCLVSIVSGAADLLGLYRFDWVDFTTTGTSTHQYTIYMDGTAKTSAPIGIRGVDFTACSVFGGGISTMLVKGVLKFSFLGGGVYTSGGVAGSNIRFDGVAAVPTQSFTFLPSDCSCPISFDRAILGIFGCGIMGAITNTANTENVYGFGFSGSVQQNWGNSMFFDTSTGLKLTQNQKIANTGAAPNFALEMFGNITGFSKSGSVTTIGQAGVAYSTVCPNSQTFAFDTASAKLFTIATGGGAAALVFADYKSNTITLVSNPSTEFQASSTPGAGYTGIFKSSNSHTISVKNNTGSSVIYSVLSSGAVTGTTDPA